MIRSWFPVLDEPVIEEEPGEDVFQAYTAFENPIAPITVLGPEIVFLDAEDDFVPEDGIDLVLAFPPDIPPAVSATYILRSGSRYNAFNPSESIAH